MPAAPRPATAAVTRPAATGRTATGTHRERPLDRVPLFWGPVVPSLAGGRSAGAAAIDPVPDTARNRDPLDDTLARRVVDAVLAGDRDAFGELVERDSTLVVRVCHRVLGNAHDAEDAAQEAFVTAFRALGTWRGEGSFGSWISRIAVRTALRHAGRRGRNRQLAWSEPPGDGDTTTDLIERIPVSDGGGDPAHFLIRAERSDRVRAAVAGLEDPYREVVALRFFGELSLAEIAQASGRPVGTIKTHLHRGLLRLRRELEGEW
jgi:RNA polymerase sigma-70 factor, ECF subfamily